MASPTMPLGDVRAGRLAGAAPGTLVSFVRNGQIVTGLALGTADTPATHVLFEGEGGVPWGIAYSCRGDQRTPLAVTGCRKRRLARPTPLFLAHSGVGI